MRWVVQQRPDWVIIVSVAFLASFIDRAVTGSVTPIAVGYLVYGVASLGCQVWAGALSGDSSRPVADHTS